MIDISKQMEKKQIVMVCYGSRGDLVPFLSLKKALENEGQRPILVCYNNALSHVKKNVSKNIIESYMSC
jgi:hypothetical protein